MKTPIVIVGSGSLAKAIEKQCVAQKIAYSFWLRETPNKKCIVLYCGTQRLFKDVSTFCASTMSTLVLLSTDVAYTKSPKYPFLFVPNSSTQVQEFIKVVSDFAAHTQYTRVSIIESHQQAKKDVSGTARLLARNLGKTPRIITSIRDPKKQIALGIPKKHLKGHAYHKITFIHDGLTTDFSILVLGRETYAKGALEIAKSFSK